MNFLDKIAAERKLGFSFEKKSLIGAILEEDDVALIAEIKRKSPNGGNLRRLDAAKTALEMESAGAAAISVLTEPKYFGGSLEDLAAVKRSVGIPVLRKDFIVDINQLNESVLYGADAVLLIASILGAETEYFVDVAHELGLECLVEVHNEADVDYALGSRAKIIGINNRDLSTLKVDLNTTEKLAPKISKSRLIVAESGVSSRKDVERMKKAGAKAVLVGTSIMKSNNLRKKIMELSGK